MYRDKLYAKNSPRFKQTSKLILDLLDKEPMSKHELAKQSGLNHSTICNYIYFLKEEKLIHISGWHQNPLGKATAIYKFGDDEDAEFIARKKYKSPYKPKGEVYNFKMPRCDVAASWMRNPIC